MDRIRRSKRLQVARRHPTRPYTALQAQSGPCRPFPEGPGPSCEQRQLSDVLHKIKSSRPFPALRVFHVGCNVGGRRFCVRFGLACPGVSCRYCRACRFCQLSQIQVNSSSRAGAEGRRQPVTSTSSVCGHRLAMGPSLRAPAWRLSAGVAGPSSGTRGTWTTSWIYC